eukprot:298355_1
MPILIVSANIEFLQSIQKVISTHCLNSNSKSHGTIRRTSTNCYDLRYCSQSVCSDIGTWIYGSSDSDHNTMMKRKYDRYLLFKKLFIDNKICKKEREYEIERFLQWEKQIKENTLQTLMKICNTELPNPNQYRFRKNFSHCS